MTLKLTIQIMSWNFKKLKAENSNLKKKSFNNFYKFHIQMIYSVFVNLQN